MTDWTSGYVADIGYTYGYYPELNPLRNNIALLSKGLAIPRCETACELGFGQGLSTNLHAATTNVEWHGTDFNPSQAGFAQSLAAVSGSKARLYDEGFAEFCHRSDIPDFDYIGLHGIWSWISDENRAIIVEFVRRKLKVGGVLYVSYNTLPGWAAFAPIRHLMTEHAEVIGSAGRGIVSRIDDAIEFADRMLATNPIYSRANPLVADRIKKLKDQNRHYLAHEYFNRDWHPMHFATMAEWMKPAKVHYACSAHYLDHIDALNLTSEQQEFLKEIPDAMFYESVKDFMINQQFRRDYWIKGPRTLSVLEQAEALGAQQVVLTTYREDVSLKLRGALGDATMNESVYNPLLDLLSDYKVKTLAQLEAGLKGRNIAFNQLLQATQALMGAGHLAPAQDESMIRSVKKPTEKLNAHLIEKARGSPEVTHLGSPVTGGGINIGRFPQLFLLAYSQGRKQPEEWAKYAWAILAMQNQKIVKDGTPLDTPEENLAELMAQAKIFGQRQLPILKALQIA